MNLENNSKEIKLIVITGGPGAGKTAVLEMAKKYISKKFVVLPEAASIIFGGGFWRLPSISARAAAQRAIYHVQNEMEKLIVDEKKYSIVLCDRGTLDGLAYWPLDEKDFWEIGNSSIQKEFNKYYAVIHLRTPSDYSGYNHENPLRIETAEQSCLIDKKIAKIWEKHPKYEVIFSTDNFLNKAQKAIDKILKFENYSS